ncbi:aquaporin family protein [Lactiplantibacillus plantarum]|uniref:MIP/aquaporin family protein n=1 Tax=Lactiplantibacillus plantarum TaxID=1590 RepID=UPI0002B3FBAC|nr:MIP/aquaporin family protein [Lactiplantibacillus plantarum]AGE37610.1 Glycerol uptake facilitator protein [Lactiplantibacillus plantarum ZJ316]ANI96397.1 aquaporin [Lactiplantibacillus plantarum]AYG27893.1 aquaporin family protein [Lactiplantibacillus plantarum]MCB7138413.1 aquaporin family protein [Lactiplantibacillus plantarum]MCB7149625.1 aquaporin family protein [Lactiplantibacillus plantarum]
MTGSWEARYAAEFFGTLILVLLGNGAVANAFLKNTTGNDDPGLANGGWLLVASGYGLGVMLPAMMFGSISGNHLNPAITIGQAVIGIHVAPYLIWQFLGAIAGQCLILALYWPHYRQTTDNEAVLGTFATSDHANSQLNGFVTEMVGTAVLIFGAMGLYRGMFFHQNIDIANIGVGLLIAAMVISLGGPTGPTLNPARDLGPRLVHALFPVPNKGSSHWEYSWVPVVAPIVGAVIGIWIYKIFFGL